MTPSTQPRILVIDDDEGTRRSLETILRDEGYVVDVAENGQEAIRKSTESYYNVALLDLRLPDVDGIRLLTEMKETVPHLIKIIMTGYPSLENAIEAANRGADAYMTKPYIMDDLLRTIREHLKKQEEARRYSEQKVKEFIESPFEEHENKKPSGDLKQ